MSLDLWTYTIHVSPSSAAALHQYHLPFLYPFSLLYCFGSKKGFVLCFGNFVCCSHCSLLYSLMRRKHQGGLNWSQRHILLLRGSRFCFQRSISIDPIVILDLQVKKTCLRRKEEEKRKKSQFPLISKSPTFLFSISSYTSQVRPIVGTWLHFRRYVIKRK